MIEDDISFKMTMDRLRYDDWRYAQEQEQYAKLAQEIVNKVAQSMYYGNVRAVIETITKTTEVRTVVYTFPELDLD